MGSCPIKVRWSHEKRAIGIRRHTGTISVTTEAETEVMEAQEGLGLLSATGNWEEAGFFPRYLRGSVPPSTGDLRLLASRTGRESIPVGLSPSVHGVLLWLP